MCTCSPGVKGGKGINHLPPLSWLFCLYERWSKRLPGKYIQSGQEVNPSLFRSKKWTDCIQIKTALNRNSRILVISKRHANEKKVPTLWTGEIDINPQNPAVASIDFHHSTPLPTSGFAGDWWKGFVEKFHEKDWKRLDVCSYGVVLMFLLQHSAPHYFREPIVHRFESRCHNLWHLCIQIHHWISSSWEESEGIGKHTHTHTHPPKHPESRNVDLDPSLPSCRRQKNGPWNDIPMARVATLGKEVWHSTYDDNLKKLLCTRSTFSFFSRPSILRIDVFDCKGGAIYSETDAGANPLGT